MNQKQQLTKQQKADIFYARILAVIDFANDVDRALWRKHCNQMRSAAAAREQNGPSANHVQPVSHG